VQESPIGYHALKGGPTFKGPVARSLKIDPVASANFTVIDRGPARALKVTP
jgi:hypothetical protein